MDASLQSIEGWMPVCRVWREEWQSSPAKDTNCNTLPEGGHPDIGSAHTVGVKGTQPYYTVGVKGIQSYCYLEGVEYNIL